MIEDYIEYLKNIIIDDNMTLFYVEQKLKKFNDLKLEFAYLRDNNGRFLIYHYQDNNGNIISKKDRL